VDHGEVGGHAGVFKVAQPLAFVLRKLFPRPVDGVGGVRVESFQRIVRRAVFVVVAFHAGDVHLADDGEAFLGVGVVTDDVAEADDMGCVLGLDVGQNGLEGFQVAVDVSDDGVSHFS
jgi:hypothetical protein